MMLQLSGVHAHYGAIHALHGVDLAVQVGEVVTLIGANGAGKSTLMMAIFGQPRASSGRIVFDGEDITALPTHDIARRGIALVPEGRRIFPRMTVMENLQMGASLDNLKFYDEDVEKVFTLFPRLKERIGQRGGTLLVCEGLPDALTASQAGFPAVALLGAQTPDESVAARLANYAANHGLDPDDARIDVARALRHLTPRQRRLCELLGAEGLSISEVALMN